MQRKLVEPAKRVAKYDAVIFKTQRGHKMVEWGVNLQFTFNLRKNFPLFHCVGDGFTANQCPNALLRGVWASGQTFRLAGDAECGHSGAGAELAVPGV